MTARRGRAGQTAGPPPAGRGQAPRPRFRAAKASVSPSCSRATSSALQRSGFSGRLLQALAVASTELRQGLAPAPLSTRHVIVEDVGFEAIGEQVSQPLKGLRVAPYYGCLIVRPSLDEAFDDPEYPTSLDRLMQTLGATVVDYPVKAHCCGGHMTQISPETGLELIRQQPGGGPLAHGRVGSQHGDL